MSTSYRIKPFNIELDKTEFTPSSLITTINEKLTAQEAPEIVIKGFCPGLGEPAYYGYYFGKIVDPDNSAFSVKIKVSEQLKPKIIPNTICTMRGFLEKQISLSKDSIGVIVRVAEVLSVEVCNSTQNNEKEKEQLIAEKKDRGTINVRNRLLSQLRKEVKPRILIITGEKSVAYNDVLESLGQSKNFYILEDRRVNFRNADHICAALSDAEKQGDFDVIAIVRGGGDGLEIFSDICVLKAAAEIKSSCLVSAVGHYEDQPAIDLIADHQCGTPTAFGNFLSKAVGTIRYENANKEAQASKRTAWGVAVAAVIGFLFVLIQHYKN